MHTSQIVGFVVHRGDAHAWDCAGCSSGDSRPILAKISQFAHDRPYRFHQWQGNLRILDVRQIKTVPMVPLSPSPFVERLIGTIRRECLDCTLFWTAADVGRRLECHRAQPE